MYKIVYAKTALKDIPKLKSAHLDEKAKALISVIKENPFQNPPPYEKLVGDLNGSYSRRINVQHRLVYDVFEEEQTIKILSLWTPYERGPEDVFILCQTPPLNFLVRCIVMLVWSSKKKKKKKFPVR